MSGVDVEKSSTYLLTHRLHIYYELSVQYSVHERLSGSVRVRKPESGNLVVRVVPVNLRGVDGRVKIERSKKTHQINELTSTVWVSLQKE